MMLYVIKEGDGVKRGKEGRYERAVKTVRAISRRLDDDGVYVYAAHSSFFVVISAFPFIMLLLNLLRYIFPFGEHELYSLACEYLPQKLLPYADVLVSELYLSSGIPIISISALVVLWTASQGLRGIIKGLRGIYHSEKSGYIKNSIVSLFMTVIFITLITVTLALIFFGHTIIVRIEDHFSIALRENVFYILIKNMLMPALIIGGLVGVYSSQSASRMKPSSHFVGAAFTGVAWIIFSRGYAFYIDVFADYSYIYGSLTAIVLFMLWLYACMTILFCGAELNLYLYTRRRERNILSKK